MFRLLSHIYRFEVVKTSGILDKPKIFGLKICREDSGCYSFSIRHSGEFNLREYEKLEFEVKSAKLIRKG
jgi:hypothetical protein